MKYYGVPLVVAMVIVVVVGALVVVDFVVWQDNQRKACEARGGIAYDKFCLTEDGRILR